MAAAFAAKDPVIMTINGVDVPQSEFEYLYNKNSQQQINPQTIEEYMDMFQLYKMKVADAIAEGIDTLPNFKKEMAQYREELAAPYMVDSVYLNKLVDEAYARSLKEVDTKHIMLFKTRDASRNMELRALIDSLKGVLDNGGNFEELARKYSQDRSSNSRGGSMGYIVAGVYPYSFEKAAYSLSEGEISDVVESPVGYHILKVGKSRDARGKVKASHILKLTQPGRDPAIAKAAIDSLYAVVKADPSKFAEVARQYSDDKGSARQGGSLSWFGTGEMIAEFDSVAFAMPVKTISEPFATSYGYHIIYKEDAQGPLNKEQVKKVQLMRMGNPQDERFKMIRENRNSNLAKRFKGKLNENALTVLRNEMKNQGLDSAFFVKAAAEPVASLVIFEVNGKPAKAGEFVSSFDKVRQSNPELAEQIFNDNLNSRYEAALLEAEENYLEKNVPDYRNLLKEYTDGSLLYEVSVRKVWDKAAKDTEGLARYFKAHKDNYKWTEPRVKGVFVQTKNDSLATVIKERVKNLSPEEMVETLRKDFRGEIAVEKILIAKGGNPMVDYVAFGGPKVESSSQSLPVFFMIGERILTAPEEVSDVKGQVTSDYQNEFQAAWEKELRKKYPVTVNKKVLKKVAQKK